MLTYEEKAHRFTELVLGPFAVTPDLFRQIRESAETLDDLHRAEHSMRRELDAFLETYYARILPLCEKLERLRAGIDHMEEAAAPVVVAEAKRPDNETEERMKSFYRTLVKYYHPDNNATQERAQPLESVITAYKRYNVGTLWLLNIEREVWTISDPLALERYLARQLGEMTHHIEDAHARRRDILRSPTWLLKEKVFDASLQGDDLIETIARQISVQIDAVTASSYCGAANVEISAQSEQQPAHA